MSDQDPGKTQTAPALTALPKVEDLPRAGEGYDADKVREAFDAFRRHAAQLQAQLRVLQAAGRGGQVEATGHAVRMDALHLIRGAAEVLVATGCSVQLMLDSSGELLLLPPPFVRDLRERWRAGGLA